MKPTRQLSQGVRFGVWAGFALIAGMLLAYAVMLATGSEAWTAQDVAYFGTMAIAGILCATRAALIPFKRTAWILITGVVLGNLVGDLLDYYLSLPSPSFPEALWISTYFLMLAALISLLIPVAKGQRGMLLLDWLIATLTISAAAVLVLLPAIVEPDTGASFASVITALFPITDIVVLAAVLVALLAGTQRKGPAMLLIVAASLVWLVGDSLYSYQTVDGTGEYAAVLDLGWPLSLALLAAAAWAPDTVRVDRMALRRRAGLIAGFGILVALAVLLVREYRDNQYLAVVLLSAVAVAGGGLRLILTHREISQLLKAANTDHLTGIPSGAKLSADAAVLEGSPTTVIMLDLDGFKFYNDSFGHPAGDALLRRVAANLVQASGPEGRAYRIGGDEFCVLLPGEASENQPDIEAVGKATHIAGEGFKISASMGYADYPFEDDDVLGVLAIADNRMYMQKNLARTSPRSQVHDVLVRSLREREPALAEHTSRVSQLAGAVAEEIALSQEEYEIIERAAELHDVGKAATPDSILHKPGRLEPEEWDLMKQHTVIGERIISASPSLSPVAKLVRHSHEHWDGGGYPDQLSGTDIPLGSRIILSCDALEVMLSERPYSPALPLDVALEELERCAGDQFDPDVVAVLVRLVREGRVDPLPGPQELLS